MPSTGLTQELRGQQREGGTVYPQIREQLRATLIEGGKPGDRVPPERELARHFSVSPVTIGRALKELQSEGLVERIIGKGTFISFRQGGESRPAELRVPRASTLDLPASLASQSLQPNEVPQSYVWIVSDFQPNDIKDHAQLRWSLRAITSIERAVQQSGGRTVVTNARAGQNPNRLVDDMLKQGVNTIIVVGPKPFDMERRDFTSTLVKVRAQKRHEPFAIVLLPLNDQALPFDTIRFDDECAIYDAVSHLVEQGHQYLAMLLPDEGWSSSVPWVEKRRQAFEAALVANGAKGELFWGNVDQFDENFLHESFGQSCAAQFMELRKIQLDGEYSPITGVIAINDPIALQFISEVTEKGIRVPNDIAVMGFDNNPATTWRGLTTFHVPIEEMAEKAVEIARHRLGQSKRNGRLEIVLDPVMIVRETSSKSLR